MGPVNPPKSFKIEWKQSLGLTKTIETSIDMKTITKTIIIIINSLHIYKSTIRNSINSVKVLTPRIVE